MNRVVYLHGFASGPSSTKAQWFGKRLAEYGVPFEAPDLAAGDFKHLTISGQLRVIEAVCRDEPITLLGSSLGGYLAALYAARHPEVDRLVLMAPAFCFGRRFAHMFDAQQVTEWRRTGLLPIYHYGEGAHRNLSYRMMEDAEQYEDYPDFHQSALILHGTGDTVAPPELSATFAAAHSNVRLVLLESDHELRDVLEAMWKETARFLALDRRDLLS